ncbi:hypothetical protein AVEN_105090-1 [Araneus ventricosus]|uniref:Uncharacterized protein n=1 Tax=Araneus ventricosus TaxID=182803 RepID=A0A4Y2R6K2_ARAVE|nr:hypothetical protein AVEN_105090-1 [Araneus ventricosus]
MTKEPIPWAMDLHGEDAASPRPEWALITEEKSKNVSWEEISDAQSTKSQNVLIDNRLRRALFRSDVVPEDHGQTDV